MTASCLSIVLLSSLFSLCLGNLRWRGNQYIQEEGLLPYQRCNSNNGWLGAEKVSHSFKYQSKTYDLVSTAASVWGNSDIYGKPTELRYIEILAYFTARGRECMIDPDKHCAVPHLDPLPPIKCSYSLDNNIYREVNGILVYPPLFGVGMSHLGRMKNDSYYTDNKQYKSDQSGIRPIVTIQCPINNVTWLMSSDKMDIEVTIGDMKDTKMADGGSTGNTIKAKQDHRSLRWREYHRRGNATTTKFLTFVNNAFKDNAMTIDLCYIHVNQPAEAVVCTEPHFGYDRRNSFWSGDPPFARQYTLLDQFLVYHVDVMKVKVQYQDAYKDSYHAIKPYVDHNDHNHHHNNNNRKDPKIFYRLGWRELGASFKTKYKYDFESYAETSCYFEHRLDSKWAVTLHAVDNFFLPGQQGETLASMVGKLDADICSMSIPIQWGCVLPSYQQKCHKMMKNKYFNQPLCISDCQHQAAPLNILQRLDGKIASEKNHLYKERYTPLGNPRKVSFTWVHWLNIYKQEYLRANDSGKYSHYSRQKCRSIDAPTTWKKYGMHTVHFHQPLQIQIQVCAQETERDNYVKVLANRLERALETRKGKTWGDKRKQTGNRTETNKA